MSSSQVGGPKTKAKDPEAEQLQAVLRVRLKQLIERFPGRQTELAEKAGLKQSNISETFNHMPTLAKALKICRAAGVVRLRSVKKNLLIKVTTCHVRYVKKNLLIRLTTCHVRYVQI